VIGEASAHQIKGSEFKERLAAAAEPRNAIIVERTMKEQEAEQQRIADEKRKKAEAEQQRIADEKRKKAEAEQQRIAAEERRRADEVIRLHGKPPSGFAVALQRRAVWLREQGSPDAISTDFPVGLRSIPTTYGPVKLASFPHFPWARWRPR
jgi:hypothetical protein